MHGPDKNEFYQLVAFITLTIRLSGSATVRRLGRIEHKRTVDYPVKRDLVALSSFRDAKQKGLAALVGQNIISDEEIYCALYHVLNTYSSRMMSFDDDKITAIGGISGAISQSVGGELVEGIWKKDLARGLLLAVKLGPLMSERRTALRVASWSWAKTHSHIGFYWFFNWDWKATS